jgi:hypothetical protein
MRYLKALGLTALAAMAMMAFFGSTAAAEADKEIVLCEELVELTGLCPEGRYLHQGSEISGLATNPKIVLTGVGTVECQDGLIKGLLGTDMGKVLTVTVTGISFGVLPTPNLGEGCTTCTQVHTVVPVGGWFEVEPLDHFYFKFEKVLFTLLNCFGGGVTCNYASGEFKSLIDRDLLEHPDWKGKKKDVILIARTLTREAGSSFFCPANAEWKGEYILTLAKNTDEGTRLFYLALEELGV